MQRHPDLPAVFRGRDAVEAGALTADQLRGPLVRRLFAGVYSPASVRVDHRLRCEAVTLLGEGQLVLTGRSAATLRGTDLARPDDPVEVIALQGHRVNRRPGVDVRRVRLDDSDHEPWGLGRIARPLRTAFDVVSRRPVVDGVADLDQLLRAGHVDRRELERRLASMHDDGVVRAREVLALADGRAESPPESVLRVVLARAGLVLEPQLEVWHGGVFVARVDLGDPGCRLAVEYDGLWHAERAAFRRDRDRLNRLQDAGWDVVSITADTLRRPQLVVDVVGSALRRRRSELRNEWRPTPRSAQIGAHAGP